MGSTDWAFSEAFDQRAPSTSHGSRPLAGAGSGARRGEKLAVSAIDPLSGRASRLGSRSADPLTGVISAFVSITLNNRRRLRLSNFNLTMRKWT
jgi:hypothetical protein